MAIKHHLTKDQQRVLGYLEELGGRAAMCDLLSAWKQEYSSSVPVDEYLRLRIRRALYQLRNRSLVQEVSPDVWEVKE